MHSTYLMKFVYFIGNTPLIYACAGGHVETVKELLKFGAKIECFNNFGRNSLMEAASGGHVRVAKVWVHYKILNIFSK